MRNKFWIVIEVITLLIVIFGGKYVFSLIEKLYGNDLEFFFKTIVVLAIFTIIYLMKYFNRPNYHNILRMYNKGWRISGFYSKYSLKSEELYKYAYDLWVKINLWVLVFFGGGSIILRFVPGFTYTKTIFYVILYLYLLIQVLCWIYTSIRTRLLYYRDNEIEKS